MENKYKESLESDLSFLKNKDLFAYILILENEVLKQEGISIIAKEYVNSEGLYYYENNNDKYELAKVIEYAKEKRKMNIGKINCDDYPSITSYDIVMEIERQISLEEELREKGISSNSDISMYKVYDIYKRIIKKILANEKTL